jgi:ABC-2 type transport system permease protein
MPEVKREATPAQIHDIGYQRYTGPRLGEWYATRSLYSHSLRTAFGIGRGFKSKLFPWSVVAVITMIAVVITAIASQSGQRVVTYFAFVDSVGPIAVLFLAVVAPELASRDLRARLLPLYFSRPLRRVDYVGAKFAALVSAVWLLVGAPQLLIFAGAAFDAKHPGKVWHEFTDLFSGLLYAGLFALIVSAVGLLVSSLTGRRAFAAGGIMAVFLVTLPIVGVLDVIGRDGAVSHLAGVVNPSLLAVGTSAWLFNRHDGPPIGGYGPVYGLVTVCLIAGCGLLLVARYRRVES